MGASNSTQSESVPETSTTSEEQECEEIKQWVERSKEIKLMVTGKTGVGKSALLNGIVGDSVFKEGDDFDPETSKVSSRKIRKAGIDIEVFDTPGLQDSSGNEQVYLSEIKDICKDIHLLLYCIRMDETRSDLHKHDSAIKIITEALSPLVWENAVIVLTFANVYERQLDEQGLTEKQQKVTFKEKMKEWENAARRSLREAGVPRNIVEKVSALPAGIAKKPSLVCQKYWVSNFWVESVFKMKEEAQSAMVKISMSRLKNEDDVKPQDFDKDISEQPIVFKTLDKAVAGGVATVGAAAGATTGALIGALAIGIPSFGLAAGLGLLLGAVIGAGVGSSSGAGVGLLIALYRKNKKKQKMVKIKKEALEDLGRDLAGP